MSVSDDPSPEMPAALRKERVREAMTMALYLSMSLLAVLVALPKSHGQEGPAAALSVLATAGGLVLAHHVAFRLSSRLVEKGLLSTESVELLGAQVAGALPVALVAAGPLLFPGGSAGRILSEILLLAFVAVVGYLAARQSASVTRSLVYVVGVVLVFGLVVVVKLVVGH